MARTRQAWWRPRFCGWSPSSLRSERRPKAITGNARTRPAGSSTSYDRVRQDYEKELKQAEVDSKRIQLEEHLDKVADPPGEAQGHHRRPHPVAGVLRDRDGQGRADILNNQKVPGIGPVLSKRLFDWRDKLAKASFRPQQTLPDSEKNRIASRYAPVMLPLGQSIQEAINDLETIASSHRERETELLKIIAATVQSLAVAEAHVMTMRVD